VNLKTGYNEAILHVRKLIQEFSEGAERR